MDPSDGSMDFPNAPSCSTPPESERRLREPIESPNRRISHRVSALRLIVAAALFSLWIPATEAIRCYCTDDHCVPAYGVCEAAVCLVGLRRPDLTVIRTCGDEPIGCQHNVDNWVDLCACDQPFCNTFSYLRESTQDTHGNNMESAMSAAVAPIIPHPQRAHVQHPEMRDRHHDSQGQLSGGGYLDEDTRVFQRVDGPHGEYVDEHGIRHRAPLSTRGSRLALLLVIVPICVGVAFVIVLGFNYYCHLC